MEEQKCRVCNLSKLPDLMVKHNTDKICKECNSILRKNKYIYKTRPFTTNGENKTCLKCNKELHYTSFPKQIGGSLGVNSTCKKCFVIVNNTPKQRENIKKWQQNNKEIINKRSRERDKEKCKTDINYKIKKHIRTRMWEVIIKKSKSTRNGSIEDLIGCSVQLYRENIERQLKPGWNWDNYGKVWEIDHKLPLSSFDLTDYKQQKIAFNFNNTQPLSVFDNRSKKDNIII
jgi:hypothetical protein